MNIVEKNPDELIEAEYNPRKITEKQLSDIKASIHRFGIVDPLIINTHEDRYNVVIGGHQRLRVAKSIGLKAVPCVEVNLNEQEERELNIRLNKNVGMWDWDQLANVFEVSDLVEWGFDESQIFNDDLDGFENVENVMPPEYDEVPSAKNNSEYTTYEIVLHRDNKAKLISAVNRVKSEQGIITQEEAIMHIIKDLL